MRNSRRKINAASSILILYSMINLLAGVLFITSVQGVMSIFCAVSGLILALVWIYIPRNPLSLIPFIPFIAIFTSNVINTDLTGASAGERLLNINILICFVFAALIILGLFNRKRRLIGLILKAVVILTAIMITVSTFLYLPRQFYGILYFLNFNGFLLALSAVFALKNY